MDLSGSFFLLSFYFARFPRPTEGWFVLPVGLMEDDIGLFELCRVRESERGFVVHLETSRNVSFCMKVRGIYGKFKI
jgi:hypothetical protein